MECDGGIIPLKNNKCRANISPQYYIIDTKNTKYFMPVKKYWIEEIYNLFDNCKQSYANKIKTLINGKQG